jgi:hypothetical protein
MDPAGFLQQALGLVSDYTLQTALTLFLVCLLAETLGFSIPIILEAAWLLAGCQFRQGSLGPFHLLELVAAAQAGRQLGAYLFYLISRVTVGPLLRLSRIMTGKRFVDRSATLINRLNLDSPFAVALGRLLYLRVPVTLVLGTRRRPGTLALGVLLSSVVFDGAFLLIGAAAGSAASLNPWLLIFIFLAGLGGMYLLFFILRHFRRRLLAAGAPAPRSDLPPSPPPGPAPES